jgi:hypothetical protein
MKKNYFIAIPVLVLFIGILGGYFVYTKIALTQKPKDKIVSQNTSNANLIEDNKANDNLTTSSGEVEQGLKEKLQKYDGQGSVDVSGSLMNPIEKNDKYIIIEAQFNTHSVDLDAYDFQKIASFKTSDGIEINKEIVWEKEDGGGHHFLGKYKIPEVVNGKPIITEKTEFIELDIKNLDNVENRAFKWEKDIVKLLLG